MAGTEVASSLGVISFDFHVWVTKADNDDFTAFVFDINGKLLWSAAGSEWFVEGDLSALVLGRFQLNYWCFNPPILVLGEVVGERLLVSSPGLFATRMGLGKKVIVLLVVGVGWATVA